MAANDILNNLQSNAQDDGVTIDDVNSYAVKQLSPEQEQAFNDQNPGYTATGSLNTADYYPGMNRPLGVGNYSGSVVGSNTIYAAQPALVPYGIFDAREKAIQNAALSKVKEVDEFRKAFKAPTSKLVNINPELTKQYTSFLDDSWKKAMAKSGGNGMKAKAILQNDPEFSRREKSYQDLAKYGDEIVSKWAKDDEDIKTGKFTPTPTYKEAKRKMLTALDPSSKEFANLGNTFRTMKVERDFSDAYNNIVDKMVQNQTATAGMDPNDPDFIKIRETTVKSWSPEQKAAVAEQMKNIYNGNDYFTPSKIENDLKTMMAGEVKTSNLEVKQMREADSGSGFKYDFNTDAAKEPNSTNVFTSKGQGNAPGVGEMVGQYGITHKKEIPLTKPSGRNFYINDEANGLIKTNAVDPNAKTKLFKTEIVKVYDGAVDKNKGTPLSEQQIADGKTPWKYATMTSGVMTKLDPNTGEEKDIQFYVPTKEVENTLVGKRDKSGKVVSGIPVDDMYAKAEEMNKSKGTTTKSTTAEKPKARKYKGLDKAGNPIFE